MKPKWSESSDYDFLKQLRSELIAWQFLRRNPEYQQDYKWFIETWRQLELNYGSAPNRDFAAWKKDPRAYRSEHEIVFPNEKTSTVSASDHDKLLIECWMGAKWGFYKFPIHPNISEPNLSSELTWRTSPVSVKLINEGSLQQDSLSNHNNKTAIIFDLNKNLKEQLQSAKQQLIIAQKNNATKHDLLQQWILYLRVIDAMQCEVGEAKIKVQLGLTQQELNQTKEKSQSMMVFHYREIITII